MEPLFVLKDVDKSFGKTPVLKNVNVTFYEGQITCIIGPSGSGKSTLLRMLNLLEYPSTGRVIFQGQMVNQKGVKVEHLRQQVGMVFQSFHLFPHLNVLSNCMLAPLKVLNASKKEVEARARMYLKKVGLEAYTHASVQTLSGGQKQRVAIARALTMQPKVLLFDEPTSALDPELVKEVLNVMQDLAREGMTMLIVTHEIDFARQVADRVLFLDKGLIVEDGSPDEVLNHPQNERTRQFLSRLSG
jgi:ABC-type polar amino acid transport system ATPase subunit